MPIIKRIPMINGIEPDGTRAIAAGNDDVFA
jgi:hypothetical protein